MNGRFAGMRILAAPLLAAFAVSCGGGSGTSSGPPPVPTASPVPTGTERITITIPPKTSSSVARAPRYISPSTQSISVTLPGGATTTVALTPTNPQCRNQGTSVVCTADVQVPVGTTTVVVSTFASTDGSGTPLAKAAVSITVVAGTVQAVNVTLNGVVASLFLSVAPTTLTNGEPFTASVTVGAKDAAGNTIVGPEPYADVNGNPISITLTDGDTSGATMLSQASVTAPTASVTLNYNGATTSNFTVSASAPGVSAVSVPIVVKTNAPQTVYLAQATFAACGPAQLAVNGYHVLSGGGVGSETSSLQLSDIPSALSLDRVADGFVLVGQSIVRFPLGASGSAQPSATIAGPLTGLVRPVQIAAEGAGAVWVADPGENPPALVRFAAGANGNVAPLQKVISIVGMPPSLTFEGATVAVDSHDNVYTIVGQSSGTSARVYAFAPTANGAAQPVASYPLDRGSASIVAVDQRTDTVYLSGANVYAGGSPSPPAPGAVPIDIYGLVAYPPGASSPSRVLYGQNAFPNPNGVNPALVTGLAADAADNVYVSYYAPTSNRVPCYDGRVSTFGPAQTGNVAPLNNFSTPAQMLGIGIPAPPPTPSSVGRGVHTRSR